MIKSVVKTCTIIFTLLLVTNSSAQEIGKIIPASKADSLFGYVKYSVDIPLKEAAKFLDTKSKYIMFDIIKNKLVVLDQERKDILNSERIPISKELVFKAYSISKYAGLLNSITKETKTDSTVRFEQRAKIFSITYGNLTLEYAHECPPDCP